MSDGASRIEAAEEALAHLATWEVQSGTGALEMCRLLSLVIEDFASALKAIAGQFEEGPFHPELTEIVTDLAQKMVMASWRAEDLEVVFKDRHEADLRRLEAPGAEIWDVSRNEDY